MEKMEKIKVVIDTNVFISALINPNGIPGKILDLIFEEKIVNYTSHSILKEIGFKCLSPKLRRYLGNENRILKILTAFSSISVIINPNTNFNVCRDEDDNKFIDVAYESKSIIITGDKDLISLRDKNKHLKINNISLKILTPKEFLEEFEKFIY